MPLLLCSMLLVLTAATSGAQLSIVAVEPVVEQGGNLLPVTALACRITGAQSTPVVRWRHENETFTEASTGKYVVTIDPSQPGNLTVLTISDLVYTDSGVYICEAMDNSSSWVSATVELRLLSSTTTTSTTSSTTNIPMASITARTVITVIIGVSLLIALLVTCLSLANYTISRLNHCYTKKRIKREYNAQQLMPLNTINNGMSTQTQPTPINNRVTRPRPTTLPMLMETGHGSNNTAAVDEVYDESVPLQVPNVKESPTPRPVSTETDAYEVCGGDTSYELISTAAINEVNDESVPLNATVPLSSGDKESTAANSHDVRYVNTVLQVNTYDDDDDYI